MSASSKVEPFEACTPARELYLLLLDPIDDDSAR